MLKTLFPMRYERTLATEGPAANNILSANLFGPAVILGGALRSPNYMEKAGLDPNILKQFGHIGGTGGGSTDDTSELTRVSPTRGTLVAKDDVHAVVGWGTAVSVGDRSVVEASGRANVTAGDNSTVLVSGSANSSLRVGDASVAVGGAGNDYISGGNNAVVRGGDGADFVSVGDGSVVSGDDGNDIISAGRLSIVDGGDGNDRIDAGPGSTLVGGLGNDAITVRGPSTGTPDNTPSSIVGGKGDDTIEILRTAADMEYSRGDGSDLIKGDLGLSTLKLTDLRQSDVEIETVVNGAGYTDLIIKINGIEDTIMIKNANDTKNAEFTLIFRGGVERTMSDLGLPPPPPPPEEPAATPS